MAVSDVAVTTPAAFITWAAPDFTERPDPSALDLHFAMREESFAVGGDTTVPGARMGPSAIIYPGNPLVVYGIDNAIRSVLLDRRAWRFGAPETIAARGVYPALAASPDMRHAVAAWANVDSNRLLIAQHREPPRLRQPWASVDCSRVLSARRTASRSAGSGASP